MSAANILIVTAILPDPDSTNGRQPQVANPNTAFSYRINNGFQTLSSTNSNGWNDVEGLLYVPTLPDTLNDACTDARNLIPSNVTTKASIPGGRDYPLVAFFPWTMSDDCVDGYLMQARADAVRGLITYQPDVNPTPDPRDMSWALFTSDRWKSENQYPVYAVSGVLGAQLLDQLSYYSGNVSNAPGAQQLDASTQPGDLARLLAHVNVQGRASVPSLWIFLIIVLAVLLGIVILASIVMHLIQRHQRRVLQRRLERGEVDLESLGINKMNVPQHKIDEMPKYTFVEGVAAPAAAITPTSKRNLAPMSQHHEASFSQTTCPICLDDFVSHETEVRELPCKHIFHPECIDLFLRDNSSLCPMCKKSALPPGYCPVKVTNLMVRRERLVRRMRERRRQGVAAAIARAGGEQPAPANRTEAAQRWLSNRLRPSVPAPSAQTPTTTTAQQDSQIGPATNRNDVELGQMSSVNINSPAQLPDEQLRAATVDPRRQTMAVPADVAAQGATARRAWRRERLARQQEEAYQQQAETAREVDVGRPLWRRIASRVIPGVD